MWGVEVHPMHSPLLDGGNNLLLPRSPIESTRHDPPSPPTRYPTKPSEGGLGDRHFKHAPDTRGSAISSSRRISFPFPSRAEVNRGTLPEGATGPNLDGLSGVLG